MVDTQSITQKRKANTTTFSLYDSDEETKTPTKKVFQNDDNPINNSSVNCSNPSFSSSTLNSDGLGLVLYSVCIERKGEREEMQDRHLAINSFESYFGDLLPLVADDSQGVGSLRCALYALFDGHAGRRAADYCAEHFARVFISLFRKYIPPKSAVLLFEKSVRKIFIETYKSIDDGFLFEARKQKPTMKDGTTATSLFLLDKTLYCANIGDSKAIVCRYKAEKNKNIPLQLTVDHNPIVFDERMRIQKAGGTVKDGRVMGVLEVSRSIGDGQMKAHGVISTPDIKKMSLTNDDLFILLACDGLWKAFMPEDAIDFVIEQYKSFVKSVEFNGGKNSTGLWTKIADEMSAEAVRRGCGDNVTVMLVVVADVSKFNHAFGED